MGHIFTNVTRYHNFVSSLITGLSVYSQFLLNDCNFGSVTFIGHDNAVRRRLHH